MKAMLLAAGRGERLRPLTDRIPKPLIEVGGRPLIEHHLLALATAGISEFIINLAWRGDLIEQRLGDGSAYGVEILYTREPPGALETAGGIRNALPLIGDSPFVVVSADTLTDYPFKALLSVVPAEFGHLVLVANPPHHPAGDFGLHDGRVTRTTPRHTYSGIGLFRPEPFADLEPGPRPLRPLFEAAIDAGQLSGEHFSGRWLDVGTPERLRLARRAAGDDPDPTDPPSPTAA
ncbi:MAG: nucleotidyltransferase family protein [Wenzhouxiangella sp.]|jgi:MurNAc alpha-1-phosphate uridylyltransferase|nr:nucleotidyltransferase family protein [Wenzhouxiangella sp.]